MMEHLQATVSLERARQLVRDLWESGVSNRGIGANAREVSFWNGYAIGRRQASRQLAHAIGEPDPAKEHVMSQGQSVAPPPSQDELPPISLEALVTAAVAQEIDRRLGVDKPPLSDGVGVITAFSPSNEWIAEHLSKSLELYGVAVGVTNHDTPIRHSAAGLQGGINARLALAGRDLLIRFKADFIDHT